MNKKKTYFKNKEKKSKRKRPCTRADAEYEGWGCAPTMRDISLTDRIGKVLFDLENYSLNYQWLTRTKKLLVKV